MKSRLSQTSAPNSSSASFPDADRLAALRGWYAGLSSRAAVERYLPNERATVASARGLIGSVRRQLIEFAQQRQRVDLVALFEHAVNERMKKASAVAHAIELLRALPVPQPQIADDLGLWLTPRAARVLRNHGIRTLADLTVRVPRRRGWWRAIAGLGQTSARHIEAFFESHPQLTERAGVDCSVLAYHCCPLGEVANAE